VPQHHRRAVRRDLDNVVGGVRVRLGKEGNHDFVNARGGPDVGPSFADIIARAPGSTRSPRTARPGSSSRLRRSMGAAIARASGPASRTTPIPPRPGGVAIATMVSSKFTRTF